MNRVNKLLNNLTPDEQAYFIASTDIFHDSPYSCHGRPSLSRDRQVTLTLNLERTISVTDFATLNPALNWDCNIVSFPWVTTQQFISYGDNGHLLFPDGVTTIGFGGVNPVATQAGDTFTPVVMFNTAYPLTSGPLTITNTQWPALLTAPSERFQYEVISVGMEILNTTPDLYRGGSVIRYRVPVSGSETQMSVEGVLSSSALRVMPMPPANSQQAMLYADSELDKAAAGSYQIHTRQLSSDKKYTGQCNVELYSNQYDAVNGNVWIPLVLTNQGASGTESPCVLGDLDIVGSYFTGLPPQTSLSIRYRVIVSYVPSSLDTNLVSLASESPPYNPKLDELVALVQMELPPGVPSSLNAKGQWWRNVLDLTSKFAPVVGSVFGPEGAAIGTGLAAVAGGINQAIPQKKAKPVVYSSVPSQQTFYEPVTPVKPLLPLNPSLLETPGRKRKSLMLATPSRKLSKRQRKLQRMRQSQLLNAEMCGSGL